MIAGLGALVRMGGVALDARVAACSDDPCARAMTASWIAGNLLAARGVRLDADVEATPVPGLHRVRAERFDDLLAALAATPALLDPATLRPRWRALAHALALPLLDRPVEAALTAGASVMSLAPAGRFLPGVA